MTPRFITPSLLLIPHTGVAGCRTRLDAFAEYLAQGLTVKEAARAMGHDQAYGNALMQRLRKRLGSQAR